MKRSSTCGSGSGDHARLVHGEGVEPRHGDLPRFLAVHPDGAAVPAESEGGGRLRALDPAHGEGVDPTVRLVGPRDGQLAAGERRPQHLLDPGGLLDVGGHQAARERLALDVGRVGGLQPVHRDVEGLAHGGEDEVEARERCLPGGQQGGEVEARRVGLAVGQPLRRAELDAVGGGPDRRALDPRLEAEGRGVEGHADLLGAGHALVEGHAHRALAGDRAAREGGHDRLLGLRQLAPLPRLLRARAHGGRRDQAQHGRENPPLASHASPLARSPAARAPITRSARHSTAFGLAAPRRAAGPGGVPPARSPAG